MKKKSNRWKVIISIAVMAIFIYFFVSFLSSSFSMVKTETVYSATVANTIDTKGYIIRNETYVTNNTDGVVVYQLQNGDSIAVGGVIAKVYNSEEDAATHKKITDIENEIVKLQKLNANVKMQGASLETINTKIHQNASTIITSFHNSDFYSLSKSRENLLYSINERQIMTGKIGDFNERIANLEQEKSNLQASASDAIAEIKSPAAGYFVDFTDGCETVYDYKKAQELNINQINKLAEKEPAAIASNVIGKVISNLNWYICCPVSAEEAKEFSEIYGDITVRMPYATAEQVPVSVAAVNQKDRNSDAAIILECKYMSDKLASLRDETVKIDVKTYSGIKVPKRALHFDNVVRTKENQDGTTTTETESVEGIYIVHGNELVFKQVINIYSDEDSDYVICDPDQTSDKLFTGKTVQLYDQVVVEGADLYAGKYVRQS